MAKGSSYLYFIGAEGLDFVKVGRSRHPESRLRQLRSASPYKLRLLRIYPDAGMLEPYVLAALRESIGITGEWFICKDIDFDALVAQAQHEMSVHMVAPQRGTKKQGTGSLGTKTGLGVLIVQARRARGLQQQELATITGISQKYLSRVENDKADPGLRIVLTIARVLHLNLNLLLGCEDTQEGRA